MIGLVQAILNIGILVSENLAEGNNIDWPFYIINEFTGVFAGILLIPALICFFTKYPLAKDNLIRSLPFYFLISIVYGVIWTSIMYLVRYLLYPLADIYRIQEIFNDLPFRYLMEYFKQFFVFWLIYYIHWNIIQYQKHQEQKERESILEAELLSARLQSLQMQLHPHFFFNTLNTVSSLMYEEPKKADRLISLMSDFLRDVIHSKDKPLHSLEREIELLKKYTDIMEVRYSDKLNVVFDIAVESLSLNVPSLILQPLVENSIKYSIDYNNSTEVRIKSTVSSEQLILEIHDNGPGISENEINYGTGLNSSVQRLKVIYKNKFQFSITSPTKSGTLVLISIPYKTLDDGL